MQASTAQMHAGKVACARGQLHSAYLSISASCTATARSSGWLRLREYSPSGLAALKVAATPALGP